MKNIRKYLAFVLALVMSLSLSVGAMADWDGDAYKAAAVVKTLADVGDLTGKTVILHTNDVHGALAGYAYIPALEAALKAKGAEVIVVDAGDFTNGNLYVSANKGAAAVELMNAAGYDVVTLGNHEFDFGYEQIKENLSKAEFKVISANIVEGDKAVYDPSYIFATESGLEVGFFGVETPETATKVNPLKIKQIDFLAGDKMYETVQKEIDALKAGGADVIIGLTHLGVDDESKTDGNRSLDLYAKLTGFDFLLDGHSHTVMSKTEGGEKIQSTGTAFANIGVLVIDNATKAVEDNYLIATEGLAKDEKVAARAKTIMDEIDAVYGTVVGKSEVELNGKKAPDGNRDSQTNNGRLITDALLWSVKNNKDIELKVDADKVFAITNGGGIRAAIKAGDVTKGNINSVMPFNNTVAIIYVTGAELLEALEASTFALPIGGYPQTSGIQWTLDTTKEFDQGEHYMLFGKETTFYQPKSINRVSVQAINGKAFDENTLYAVVTNDFIASGGDTYAAFNKAYDQAGTYHGVDTLVPMDEAVMSYIEKELGGVISAAKYATASSDLTVIEKPAEEPAPAETTPAPAETTAPADGTTYVVVPGDCLWSIAQKFLGSGKLWNTIYELNKAQIKNPDMINVGQVLLIK